MDVSPVVVSSCESDVKSSSARVRLSPDDKEKFHKVNFYTFRVAEIKDERSHIHRNVSITINLEVI